MSIRFQGTGLVPKTVSTSTPFVSAGLKMSLAEVALTAQGFQKGIWMGMEMHRTMCLKTLFTV